MIQDVSKKFEVEVEALFSKKVCFQKRNKSKIQKDFFDAFHAYAWLNHCRFGDGFEMLRCLSGDYETIFPLAKNFSCPVDELIPDLKDNKTWAALLPRLSNVTMKGVGPGEMLLSFILNAEFDTTKDLLVDGRSIECKKSSGGCLKGNKAANFRVIDELRKKYGIEKAQKSERAEGFYSLLLGLSPRGREGFWNEFYPEMCKDRIEKLMSVTDQNIKEASFIHGHVVLLEYMKIDEIDSYLLINDEEVPKITHIVDPTDEEFLKKHVKFSPKVHRGGDTNAVGDGYAVIKGK